MNKTHRVDVAGLTRDLPIITVPSGVRLAVFNILGDIEMTKAAGEALAQKLRASRPELIITTETKSVPLAYEIASVLRLPYVVLRKTYVSYMGEALESKVQSITTGHPRTIYLDAKDRELCGGKRVAIVDESFARVFFGVRGMVRELVENYATELGSWPELIVTGGDAQKLFEGWELVHAISPDLTLYGVALAYANHHIKHGT